MAGAIAEICRWWLLIAVLMAALGKTIAFGRFHQELVVSFPELHKAGGPIALSIVVIEWLLAALMLIGGAAGLCGVIGAATLFTLFTALVAMALAQDRTVVCSCFGKTSHPMSGYDLLRNGLLVGAAVFAALSPPSPAIDGYSRVALAGIACIGFQLSASLQDIAALLRIRT